MKTHLSLTLIIFLSLLGFNANAETSDPINKQLTAFPGAAGGGMFATGGRGGSVLLVTSLADDGSKGTLRWAIDQEGPRTIVFAVAGIIELEKGLKIKNGDLTIAGQSAPGDGITIKNFQTEIQADNVIIRFLRFRLGNKYPSNSGDAFSGRNCKNVIIDHCTMSWSVDECASFYDNEDFTLQWSIVSESLNNAGHSKGKHGYGGIWGGKNASFHHNLIAHHTSRNPRFNGWKRAGLKYRSLIDEERLDFRNNVIYNWGDNSSYGGEAAGKYNLVNNYFKYGPGTKTSIRSKITQIDKDTTSSILPSHGTYYLSGNYVWENNEVSVDNWKGVTIANGVDTLTSKVSTAFAHTEVPTQSAKEAYEAVIAFSGASIVRDAIDQRVTKEVETGTATYKGSITNRPGIIDKPEDVGGYPFHSPGNSICDNNSDGIPDVWLEKTCPGRKSNEISNTGYSYLELYLNSLVEHISNQQYKGATN